MTDTSDESPNEARERHEQQADATRNRRLDDLDMLEARRTRAKRLFDFAGDSVKRNKTLLIGVAAGVLVALGLIALRRRRRSRQRPGDVLAQAAQNLLGSGYVVQSVDRHDRRALKGAAKAGLGLALRIAEEMSKRHGRERLDRETAPTG
ncbi:MAG TPA: hypothetical protein VFZ53_29595 [Polyangiaceae bacterium]